MFGRVLLFCTSGLMLATGLLAAVGSLAAKSDEAGAGFAGALVGAIGLLGALTAGRGVVTLADRVVVIVANALLATCLGAGVAAAAAGVIGGGGSGLAFATLTFALIALLPLGSILAVCLMPRRARKGDETGPQPSRVGAWTAGGVGAVVFGLTVLVGALQFAVALNQSPSFDPDLVAAPAETQRGGTRFEAANFEWRSPGRPWVVIEPELVNPDAMLVARRTRPEVIFMVYAETGAELTGLTTETLAQVAIANMRSAATSVVILEQQDVERNGIDWRRLASEAEVLGRDIRYVHWITVHNGYCYQLVTFGESSMGRRIDREAVQMVDGFRQIDPDRIGLDKSLAVQPFASERFGVAADLSGEGWLHWDSIDADLPEAAFGAVRADTAAFAIIPVAIEDEPQPDPATAARGLLAMLGFAFPGPGLRVAEPIDRDGLVGLDLRGARVLEDVDFEYRIHTLQRDGAAYMIAVWWQKDVPSAQRAAEAALETVVFFDAAPWSAASVASLDADERMRMSVFNNEVGISRYEEGQYGAALASFRRAALYDPDDAVVLGNLVDTLGELGRYVEAAEVLREHAGRFASVTDVIERDAMYHAATGDHERAILKYDELFDAGYRDDSVLREYVDLLIANADTDTATGAIGRYATQPDRGPARIARANVLIAAEKPAEARALFWMADRRPLDAGSLEHLIDLAYDDKAYNEAIDACNALIDGGAGSANTYFMRGLSESALSWYRRAKTSFEKARELSPHTPIIDEHLGYVSGMLGEGENTSIAREIPAVEIPPALLEVDPSEAWLAAATESHGAANDLSLVALEFRPGRILRTTNVIRARVLDERGRDALGSFHFPFDPLSERIYVNRLVVLDAEGRVVHEGRREDWYVLDGGDGVVFDDEKTLHVPVVALRPGHVVEITVTQETLDAPEDMRFIEHPLVHARPTASSAYYLAADPGDYQSRASDGVAVIDVGAGRAWVVKDPPAYEWETRQPVWQAYLPHLSVAAPGEAWDALGAAYLDDIAERLVLDANLEALAQRLVEGTETTAERVDAIARYVQDELGYRAIAFGRRAWMPQPAEEILHARVGDCKDHSLLLHLLLEGAGVDSNLALVRVGGPILPDMPSLDQFDHMIVHVPALGETTFIDATDKYSDVANPAPYHLAGYEALVLDPDDMRLVRIAEYAPDASDCSCRRTVRIGENGTLEVKEQVILNGFSGVPYRLMLEPAARADHPAIIGEWFTMRGIPVTLESARVRNLDDPSVPLIIDVSYRTRHTADTFGDRVRVMLPALWEREVIEETGAATRRTPFELHFPVRIESVTRLELPDDLTPSSGSTDALTGALDGAFWSSSASATRQDDAIVLELKAQRHPGTHPAGRYADFIAECDATLRPFSAGIILERVHKLPSP